MASGSNRVDTSDEYYDAQTSFREILSKINNGQDLSSNEIQELPPAYQQYYFVTRDYPKEEQEMIRRNLKMRKEALAEEEVEPSREISRIQRRVEDKMPLSKDEQSTWNEYLYSVEERQKNKEAQKRYEAYFHEEEHQQIPRPEGTAHERTKPKPEQMQAIFSKLSGFQQLTKEDREHLKYDYHRKKSKNEVKIDAAYVLDDILQKKYTMEDINRVRGFDDEPESDSPVQLFHKVISNSKKNINHALQTPKSGTYFNAIDIDLATRGSPLLINEIVKQSVAGIEVLRGDPMEQNDAKLAVDSYVTATAMFEAETKIREAVSACETKQKNIEQLQPLAQSAAIYGAFSETQPNAKILGFDITSEEFDISLTPDDDPDSYKPLEIISYIGMTN